jgi:hypothetical protein
MPFGISLKVDMEVWHWEECLVDYSAATYWYAFPDTKSNLAPMPDAARLRIKTLQE